MNQAAPQHTRALLPSIDTSSWQILSEEKTVELKYPRCWIVNAGSDGTDIIAIIKPRRSASLNSSLTFSG